MNSRSHFLHARVVPPPPRDRGLRTAGGPSLIFLAVLLLSPCLFGAKQEKKAAVTKPDKAAATLVGSETCSSCHEDIYKAFLKSPHAAVDKDVKRGWKGNACESCHGPGSVHAGSTSAADIRNPAKILASAADKTCLTCHLNQPTHVGRIQGSHARNQASCASCHHVHKTEPDALLARRAAAVNKQCSSCHPSVWAAFQKPHTHPLPEGAMSCVDCHNPHGSFLPGSIRTVSANEPGCLNCHGDKRGPFAYEHAPVRLEGCATCHQPHGSANPRMLNRQEVSLQCLECHANLPLPIVSTQSGSLGGVPPAFHDLRSSRYRNCTICHVKIHGSQINRALLR